MENYISEMKRVIISEGRRTTCKDRLEQNIYQTAKDTMAIKNANQKRFVGEGSDCDEVPAAEKLDGAQGSEYAKSARPHVTDQYGHTPRRSVNAFDKHKDATPVNSSWFQPLYEADAGCHSLDDACIKYPSDCSSQGSDNASYDCSQGSDNVICQKSNHEIFKSSLELDSQDLKNMDLEKVVESGNDVDDDDLTVTGDKKSANYQGSDDGWNLRVDRTNNLSWSSLGSVNASTERPLGLHDSMHQESVNSKGLDDGCSNEWTDYFDDENSTDASRYESNPESDDEESLHSQELSDELFHYCTEDVDLILGAGFINWTDYSEDRYLEECLDMTSDFLNGAKQRIQQLIPEKRKNGGKLLLLLLACFMMLLCGLQYRQRGLLVDEQNLEIQQLKQELTASSDFKLHIQQLIRISDEDISHLKYRLVQKEQRNEYLEGLLIERMKDAADQIKSISMDVDRDYALGVAFAITAHAMAIAIFLIRQLVCKCVTGLMRSIGMF